MRVLVTGAGGAVGSELVRLLAHKGIEVRSLVRPGGGVSRLREIKDTIFYGDLTKKNHLSDMVRGIDCIYHLAAGTMGSHHEMMLNTVVATKNLMEAVRSQNIRRIVLVSTISVYQMTALAAGASLDEDCPLEINLRARDSYTITKIRQERIVGNKCREYGIPLVIIRPGKVYGPGMNPIPPQLGINVPGVCFLYIGGRSTIPLTHVSNCAEAIFLAGVDAQVEGESFNIVDDNLPNQRQYLKLYEETLGRVPRRVWLPYSMFNFLCFAFGIASRISKGNIPHVLTTYRGENLWKNLKYENSKAKSRLKWVPRIRVRDGLKEMLEYCRKQEIFTG